MEEERDTFTTVNCVLYYLVSRSKISRRCILNFTITCGLNSVDVISVINYVIDNRKLWSGFVK